MTFLGGLLSIFDWMTIGCFGRYFLTEGIRNREILEDGENVRGSSFFEQDELS